ncbi:AmpG family muropeptide MFS transporter [Chromohalobacter sp. 296-RDG]|uniref:AmpG family muropeptide MFS transporter n=1 Tax=Chromohalobacter sp. 296-RDG TaxID=2994062 RepID=UPI002468B490|nr:AmpG family muropeptide MFS transporter [Chromohalobacter sp. 296-RDG]
MTHDVAHRRWRDALAVYLQAPVITMLFLGFAAGLPFLLVFSTLTAWLRDAGVDVAAIGFFSWIGILYSIKIVWAPVVDRVALPGVGRWFGQRRSWMLCAQLTISAGLLGLAALSPPAHLIPIAGLSLLVAFGAATQDIVIDAYRIESAEESVQAAMASTYIIGYRGGLLAAGAGALYIADAVSWHAAYACMAALVGVGIITTLVRPEPQRSTLGIQLASEPRVRAFLYQHRHAPRRRRRFGAWVIGAIVCPFTDFFARHGRTALWFLLFIGLYRISDLAMAAMANPLYIDLGFSLSEIANVTKVFGIAMSILGGVAGGLLVVRFGLGRMLVAGALATALTNLMFVALANAGHSFPMLVMTIMGDNLANGLASTVFIAFLSSLTSRAYTATQYALFSSLMTLPGKFLGGFSGLVVDGVGYTGFFTVSAALGVPAVLLALWLARTQR